MPYNSNNNYSIPVKPGEITVGDISVGMEVSRNYQRFGLGDDPTRWESIKRKVIPVFDIVSSRKDLYSYKGSDSRLGVAYRNPTLNWRYSTSLSNVYGSLRLASKTIPNLNKLNSAHSEYDSEYTQEMYDAEYAAFYNSDIAQGTYGDAVVVVHIWDDTSTATNSTTQFSEFSKIIEARKRRLQMNSNSLLDIPADKKPYLHTVSVGFYDYNERLPQMNLEVCKALLNNEIYNQMVRGEEIEPGVYGPAVPGGLVATADRYADLGHWLIVPNAFVDELGEEYRDTGLADGFVVGVIKDVPVNAYIANELYSAAERIKRHSIMAGKLLPSDRYRCIDENGAFVDYNALLNENNSYVVSEYTTANYPWHCPTGFGIFTDQLAMLTQEPLMQTAPRSGIKHGALPSDILPNYYKITLYAIGDTNVATPIHAFNSEAFYTAPASDSLWIQHISELDIELPINTRRIEAVVEGIAWFTNLPLAENTPSEKSRNVALHSLSDGFQYSKTVAVPVIMPCKIQIDVRYA